MSLEYTHAAATYLQPYLRRQANNGPSVENLAAGYTHTAVYRSSHHQPPPTRQPFNHALPLYVQHDSLSRRNRASPQPPMELLYPRPWYRILWPSYQTRNRTAYTAQAPCSTRVDADKSACIIDNTLTPSDLLNANEHRPMDLFNTLLTLLQHTARFKALITL